MILKTLCNTLGDQPYLLTLYQAMMSTAYYRHFRIGEITASDHVVKAVDVHIGTNKMKMMFLLRSSKMHTKGSKPQIIKIASSGSSNKGKRFCPFALLRSYLQVRKRHIQPNEQFFMFSDGTPVLAQQCRKVLKAAIKVLVFNESLYETHSLRIGRKNDLQKMGLSVETIKKIGHWKSNAVYNYLT